MFFIIALCFLALLSITLFTLWAHEKIANKKIIPHAKIEEYWANNERREYKRFERYLEVEYSVKKKLCLKNGKTLNISKGGAMLLLDEKLPVSTILDIKMHIPEKNRRIEIEGEVVWTKETDEKDLSGKRFFHSGIKFIAIKEPYGTHFSDYISSLETRNS